MKMYKFLIPLFICANIVSAQEIGVPLRGFEGGINNNAASIALKPNESPDAMNVVIDEPWGQAKTRNGFLTCGSIPSGNTITNTHEYIRSNGVHELILTDNSNVYSTIDCINFSSVTTGLSSIAAPYFDTFRDKLWIVNKSTHAMTWDGTTLTLLDGVGTRPNPPVAQYVTHWKERVWMARTTTEPSAIYFTDLTNESGTNIDPSVSSAAWPTLNSIWIAEEDGSPIYGIKIYRDSLFVFKETGIWRVIFESNLDIQVVKAVSNVGCKFQDSIVELDNFLYFVGNDGIYKFDGVDVVRISDNIQDIFNNLKQPAGRESFQLWDLPSDWINGTLVNISTAINSGSLSLYNNTTGYLLDNFIDGDYTSNPVWTFGGANNHFLVTSNKLEYNPSLPGAGNRSGYLYTSTTTSGYGGWGIDTGGFNSSDRYSITDFAFISDSNNITTMNGYVARYTSYPPTLSLNRVTNGAYTVIGSTSCNGSDCRTVRYSISRTPDGSFSIYFKPTFGTIVTTTITVTDNTYKSSNYIILNCNTIQTVGGSQGSYFDNIYIANGYPLSGNFTSYISTYSSLSAWRSFDVDETLDGQTINYFVRTATSSYNVGLSAWNSITSGQVISTITANNYFQWKAELATNDTSKTPLVDAVTANYREGDATSTRLQAINYKNRYMLTGSTTAANNYNDIVLVKTRTPLDSWMVYDWQVSAFSKWNTYLYGGISNSANVARYDYGSNDNGSAINAYWTWGDQHWDRMSYKKNLKEIYAFYLPTQSSANTAISYSYDGGTTWTDKTVDMTGTTAFGTKKLNVNGGIGNAFRFKVSNRSLDQSFNVLGIDVWALPYAYRE